MRSPKFKEICMEVSEELNLPYEEVYDAVISRYKSFHEELANINPRDAVTDEDYDKLKKTVNMQYFGSFNLNGKYHVLKKNNYGKRSSTKGREIMDE